MVRHWLADIESPESPMIHVFGDITSDLVAIDADLAQEKFREALLRSEHVASDAAARLRWSVFIEATMRKAVALHLLGDVPGSLVAVREAMDRGLHGGFVRSFQVPGFDTLSMFQEVWQESQEATDVRVRIQRNDRFAKELQSNWLTSRELEIMQRVARGESNRDIADALFISTNTVRNHLVKAFRRLESRSRSEAVARARELGLLD